MRREGETPIMAMRAEQINITHAGEQQRSIQRSIRVLSMVSNLTQKSEAEWENS